MIADIFQRAGIKTGLFLSPHILRWNERISVNGADIPDDELHKIYHEVRREADRAGIQNALCQSDYLLCCALMYFRRMGVDVAVLECGLGGGLDGTSAVKRDIAAITRIEVDHIGVLGDNVADIAHRKCELIEPGMAIVTGRQHDEAARVIREKCEMHGAALTIAPEPYDIHVEMGKTRFSANGVSYRVGMTGEFQADNACVAISTAREYFAMSDKRVDEDVFGEAIENARIPGRMQVIAGDPLTIADCSHNPSAAHWCVETLKMLYPGKKIAAVCAVALDKEYDKMARAFEGCHVICTQCEGTVTAEELAKAFGCAESIGGFERAYQRGVEKARDTDGVLVVTGGFAVVRALLALNSKNMYNVK